MKPTGYVVREIVRNILAEEKGFKLKLYRGEKSEWWPPPEKRLVCGMTLYEPWDYEINIPNLWNKLIEKIRKLIINKAGDYAYYLRSHSMPSVLATSRTIGDAYVTDYLYEIEIEDAHTFLWGPNLTLGSPVNYKNVSDIKEDYIVLNAETIDDSTILAFGHAKVITNEVTFFQDLDINYVTRCKFKKESDESARWYDMAE